MTLIYTADQLIRETQLLATELALLVDYTVGEGAGIRALDLDPTGDFAKSRHPDDLGEVRGMAVWQYISRVERYVQHQEWHEAVPADTHSLGLIVERTFSPAVIAEYEAERADADADDIQGAFEEGAGDVPVGFFHRGILADLVALARARLKVDQGERLTMADIAMLLDVKEPTVVTNAHRKNFASIEDGNRRYAEPADALPWMIKQGYLPTRRSSAEAAPAAAEAPADARADDDLLFVPVARDGTWFSPECRSGGRYTIGAKGEEQKFTDYFEALAALVKMPTPRWRRANAEGNRGIVSGVRFDRIRRAELERALA
jgi:hypothetical protein